MAASRRCAVGVRDTGNHGDQIEDVPRLCGSTSHRAVLVSANAIEASRGPAGIAVRCFSSVCESPGKCSSHRLMKLLGTVLSTGLGELIEIQRTLRTWKSATNSLSTAQHGLWTSIPSTNSRLSLAALEGIRATKLSRTWRQTPIGVRLVHSDDISRGQAGGFAIMWPADADFRKPCIHAHASVNGRLVISRAARVFRQQGRLLRSSASPLDIRRSSPRIEVSANETRDTRRARRTRHPTDQGVLADI